MQGWIKLYRSIQNDAIWTTTTPEQKTILITILLMANHNAKEWEWQGQKFMVEPGQFITSLESIKQKAGKGITLQNVRTAIKKFKKLGFLTEEVTKTGRLISIVNWGLYQSKEYQPNKEPNKELTKNSQRANKELTPNKNERIRECKNERSNNIRPNSTEPDDANNPQENKPKFKEDDPPFKAACYLAERITANNPRQPVPDQSPANRKMQKWAEEMDRLHRLGPPGGGEGNGYTWKEIKTLIDFAHDDEFWQSNILSPGKLRKQATKLELQMQRDQKAGGKNFDKASYLNELMQEVTEEGGGEHDPGGSF